MSGENSPANATANANGSLSTWVRIMLGLVAVGLCAGFGVAASLEADASGMGTHRQLGLPECGVKRMFGTPCPACGLTTSLTHFVHGEFVASVRTQPVGLVIGLASLAAICVCSYAAASGRWPLAASPLTTANAAVWSINSLLVFRWLFVWF